MIASDIEQSLLGWYAVYPGSEKLDLGPKKAVAYVEYESHAKDLIKIYGVHGYYEQITGISKTYKVPLDNLTRDQAKEAVSKLMEDYKQEIEFPGDLKI